MKQLLLFAALVLTHSSFSQKLSSSKVPQAVKKGLSAQYPGVNATWEWEDANYEANFKVAGKSTSCVINKQGNIIETETNISLTDLPLAAREYLNKHYAGKKPKEVARLEKPGKIIEYEVLLPGKELMFDSTGNFMQIEKKGKD